MSYLNDEQVVQLDAANNRERSIVQDALRSAAKIAKITIDTETMLSVSRDDFYAAVSIVTSDECDMFGYLVFPKGTEARRCAEPGFYLLDITLNRYGRTGTAELRTLEDVVVIDRLPVEVQEAPGDAPNRAGLSLELSHNTFKAKRWKPDGGQTPGLHIVDVITIRF